MGSLSINLGILLLCLVYLFFVRVLGKPISTKKAPIAVWLIDLVVWPIGIIVFYSVVSRIVHIAGFTDGLVQLSVLQSLTMHIAIFLSLIHI